MDVFRFEDDTRGAVLQERIHICVLGSGTMQRENIAFNEDVLMCFQVLVCLKRRLEYVKLLPVQDVILSAALGVFEFQAPESMRVKRFAFYDKH